MGYCMRNKKSSPINVEVMHELQTSNHLAVASKMIVSLVVKVFNASQMQIGM